ncbi:BT4734/BF3469 family protein [Chryseobacterium sp. MEBOG07]|uniref:BT4734/BF3469 family protein n=1 Tax=Chryseobacterium sp. MEBOG07 TaxID=2879939 RepID=UPI001EFFC335|nr:BT4734/BF3469 family protein [Chryseobacterium sp. MEBOG07]UKB80230.1 PriCT-2 domain-containing protein [Chryseobacterium sp. MEBOG07]
MMKDLQISYLSNLRNSSSTVITLQDTFEEIKSDKARLFTLELNNLYKSGSELYSIKKKNLPVVTFCALFEQNNRKKEGIIKYNQLLVIDIDKLDTKLLESVKDILNNDNFIIANWVSPSGAGLKGIIKLKFNDVQLNNENIDFHHKRAFKKVSTYFLEKYNIELDKSGSDYTRLCFISCDKNITVKKSYSEFEINHDEYLELVSQSTSKVKMNVNKNLGAKDKFTLHNAIEKNSQSNKREILKIINFLKREKKSITHSYDEWLRVAFAISNTFTFDLGIKYFIELSKLDELKFNESECLTLLQDCYHNSKGTINFNTIIHFAKEKGYKQ